MDRQRRTLVLASAAAAAAAPLASFAQEWPSVKVIRAINPYAPGGSTEFVARLIAQRLGEALKQSVIVENRPGAASNIGNEAVAHAAPDGYTLLNGTSSLAINVSMYPKKTYDPLRDLTPIVTMAPAPNVHAGHPSVPASTDPARMSESR